ncbi:hypothetical protein [Psychrobacter sp.]|uniref:hypothetical protein n=1 Tax=Psychrobacter sp. TaxID=56811 RepID=UPI003BB0653F
MKSLTLLHLFAAVLFMTGCQSFQFVESPIPVKNAPVKNTPVKNSMVKTTPATTIPVQSSAQ